MDDERGDDAWLWRGFGCPTPRDPPGKKIVVSGCVVWRRRRGMADKAGVQLNVGCKGKRGSHFG